MTAEISLTDEDYLPFMVEMTSDYTPEGEEKPFPKGFRCIIIRMEDGQRLLVDFPRRGVYSIPVSVTNAASLMHAAKTANYEEAENFILGPRMAMFLGNRVVSAESGWEFVLRTDVVKRVKNWYLLYGNSDDVDTARAITAASEFYSSLSPEEREIALFVYMDIDGSKSGIQKYYDTLQPSIQAMPGYLSRGYTKSFAHVATGDSYPLVVQLASSGRILEKHVGLENIQSFLSDSNAE